MLHRHWQKRAMNSLDNVLAAFVTQMSSPKSRHFHRNQNYSQAQQRWVMSYSVDSNFPNIIYPLRTLESTSQKNQIKIDDFFPHSVCLEVLTRSIHKCQFKKTVLCFPHWNMLFPSDYYTVYLPRPLRFLECPLCTWFWYFYFPRV